MHNEPCCLKNEVEIVIFSEYLSNSLLPLVEEKLNKTIVSSLGQREVSFDPHNAVWVFSRPVHLRMKQIEQKIMIQRPV